MDVSVLVSTLYLSVLGAGFGWLILRRIDRLERRIDGLERRTGGLEERISRLEGQVGGLQAQVSAFGSDLTAVALAVGAGHRPQTG